MRSDTVSVYRDGITWRYYDEGGMEGQMVSPSISAGTQSRLKPR
jgi:hypothetical protein